jgi:UDP-N-acetylmuramate--alanine ligase
MDVRTPNHQLKNIEMGLPGIHNAENALACIALTEFLGVSEETIRKGIRTFLGVKRRFEYHIKTPNLVYIDDYAHHPTEIDAVYQALREMHPGKRTLAIFQPHLFSRTRDFADAFAQSLSQFDRVLLLDIYPAREEPLEGITSAWLLEKMTNPNGKLVTKEALAEEIEAYGPEVLVAMGAGDIGLEIQKLTNHFDHVH